MERVWRDVSGGRLWAICGRAFGICRIIIGLPSIGARGGNLPTLRLLERLGCSVRLLNRSGTGK